jgi:hypothetical protein
MENLHECNILYFSPTIIRLVKARREKEISLNVSVANETANPTAILRKSSVCWDVRPFSTGK